MIKNLFLILSIVVNTLGLGQASYKIDQSVASSDANLSNKAEATTDLLSLPEIKDRPKIDPIAAASVGIAGEAVNIAAQNYILIDSESNTVLVKKNINEKVPIASTTKIMTAAIVLEDYQLDDVVTISQTAANQIGATAGFIAGEKITVLNLLKCLLIKSANGAAYALAEHMNETGETGTAKFVAKMNEKAKELGLENTEYHDPAGLDVTGYSSAYDLTIITKYALKKDVFREIVKTKTEVVKDINGKIYHSLSNSNRLVNEWDYPGAIGVKTGYMPEAGHCLVAAVQRDGHTLISVVLHTNSDTASASADESKKLQDWGWTNTVWN